MRLPLSYLTTARTFFRASSRFFAVSSVVLSGKMDPTLRKAQSVEDRKRFEEVLPKIIDQVVSLCPKEVKNATQHFHESVMYNLPGGKLNRGLTVLATWRLLLGDKTPSEDEYYSALVLGWCVELLQASFLVADDVMDQSLTRRGKPCWYKKAILMHHHQVPAGSSFNGFFGPADGIGLVAINDAFMLECSVYRLVDTHFMDKKCYANLICLLHETSFQTETGQTIDLITKPGENFSNFTLERYKTIVKWKTGFYSFYLPVALAMYMVGIADKQVHENAKQILLEMGEFFQIQDDYLDCYGDPAVTGKIGTDIEDTKCSWLFVQALARVNEEQMKVLKHNYGINDPAAVAKVKDVYSQLDMISIYKEHEETSYTQLMNLIKNAHSDLPKEIFTELAAKIYKRDK